MRLPFSPEEFFQVFARYNDAVWPAPVVLIALAAAAVVYASRDRPGDGRRVTAILAVLWLWMAVVYHASFFAAVNRAAILFAIAFGVQAGVFVWLAVTRRTLRYRPRADVRAVAGIVIIAYAMIGYPVASYLLGHRYPAAPTFGVPCPTTIFTLGMLLWSSGASGRLASTVPILWGIVATSAAVTLGVREDFGLTVAALLTLVLVFGPRRGPRSSPAAPDGLVTTA